MDNELNRLPPALRKKNRYLKFKIHSEEVVELGEVVEAVWESCLNFLGTRGTSQVDFWIIGNQFNEEKQEGIIKVKREKIDDFRAAITLVDSMGGQKAFIQVEKVSGSIKKLKDS